MMKLGFRTSGLLLKTGITIENLDEIKFAD